MVDRRSRRQARGSATLELLERRQLLSAGLAGEMRAQPADVATPAFSVGSNGYYGFTPAQVRAAYGIDSISFNGVTGNGAGQTIAIVVAYDDPAFVDSTAAGFANSDLHKFDQQFGLADPPSFTKVSQAGSGTALPGVDPTGDWEDETALDVEWVHAAAPGAGILLVECNSDGLDDLIAGGANYARQQPGVSVVSMSFAAAESSSETRYDQYLTTPAGHQGVTFIAAAGDSGTPAEYPSASPDVVSVGGTTATLAADTYSSETALSNGGGGVSLYEPKPTFQDGLAQSEYHRCTPDVSFEANHYANGNAVYDSYNGGSADPWYSVGGTSFATQIWAGLIATADQGRAQLGLGTMDGATQTLPRLYYLSQSDFHDVTTGSNGDAAGAGYDLATGRGTPIANKLVPDLAGGASVSGNVYVDVNGDGVHDAGDVGLTGAAVYLDLYNLGSIAGIDPVVYSGAAGAFSFSDLPGGTYRLTALPYTSYVPSTATYLTVTVGYGGSVTGQLFGQRYVTGTIGGHVFEDLNLSQALTKSDPTYAGWTVFLDDNNDGVYDAGDLQTTTNSAGAYSFAGLNLGVTYHVAQVVPAGYSRTTLGGGATAPVTLLGTSATLNIGYVPNTGSISGTVYQDTNGNNVQNAGEPGIYGAAVFLDLAHTGVYVPGVDPYVLTAPDGSYTITGLGPGTYGVLEVIPIPYRSGPITEAKTIVVGVAAAVTNVNFADQLI
jgi:hypothetical protein